MPGSLGRDDIFHPAGGALDAGCPCVAVVPVRAANANPAKAANDVPSKPASLARLATFALAEPTDAEVQQWKEFECLLTIVGPAYNTPAHEYAEIRDAARRDIQAALECYRLLANEK